MKRTLTETVVSVCPSESLNFYIYFHEIRYWIYTGNSDFTLMLDILHLFFFFCLKQFLSRPLFHHHVNIVTICLLGLFLVRESDQIYLIDSADQI
jgi:hypothetical protein